MPVTAVFERTRETTWLALVLTLLVYAGLALVISGLYPARAFEELRTATRGLVSPMLVCNLLALVMVGVVIFGIGRLRLGDVGCHAQAVGPALLVIGVFWIAMQGVLALLVTFGNGPLAWHGAWLRAGFVAGDCLGLLLGLALVEEMLFRGFLLPQFYLKASRRYHWGTALVIALLGSQAAFALYHIPHDLLVRNLGSHELLIEQFLRLGSGLLFAVVYLVTRNLFVCMGLHAILDEPASLVQVSSEAAQAVWFALVLILLVSWPLARRFRTRGRATIAEGECGPSNCLTKG